MNNSTTFNSCLDNVIFTRHCDLPSLTETQWDVEQIFQQWIQDDTHLNFVTLSIVEALANVFEHGLESKETSGKSESNVIINIARKASCSVVEIIDNGEPAPSTVREKLANNGSTMPDINASELPDSGWGLNLIQFAASTIKYSTENGLNYLELTFDDKPSVSR